MSPCDNTPPNSPSSSSSLAIRHPDLSFNDGNLALLAKSRYFLVHRGLLCRQSPIFQAAVDALEDNTDVNSLEGRPVLEVQDSPEEMYYLLIALYDGISELPFTAESFEAVSALMKLATKYQVQRLRKDLLRGLSVAWPCSLVAWDAREEAMLSSNGVYEPRRFTPHPILIINLARTVNAPELLPSAFYDLSRCFISRIAAGHIAPETMECHQLSEDDLYYLLKGREEASRFLSTFLVHQLEGRQPSPDCIYLQGASQPRRRFCQAAFENIFFETLRDTNSLVCYRSCDPLSAFIDAQMTHTRDDGPQGMFLQPCDYCRAEFRAEVEAARDEFWHSLPEWFGIDVPSWG